MAVPERVRVRVIDVYPYRHVRGRTEFLVLQRSGDVAYAGTWRMVGGKIGRDEAAHEAARRELREETGREPVVLWTLPSVNVFYEWQHDRMNLTPAFAAELDADPTLDREHDAFAWLPAAQAAPRLAWPEQQRLLLLAADVLATGVPPELIVDG